MMFVLVAQASANIMSLNEGWQVRLPDTDNWIPASVPSTLMGVLTANGIEPETVPASCWYRTTFNLPALKKGEHAILSFDGISYRANVWLNGHQIANSQQMFGTFRQFEFDVTKQISQKNELTVEVLRAQPGEPNTGFVDWNPRPADESMGIFREVSLKTCGPVSLTHSAVRSRVNSKTLDEAWLTIATELTNYSDNVVSGKVKGTADGHPFECDYDKHAVFAVNETLQPAVMKASMQLIKKGSSTQEEQPIEVAPGTVVKVFDIDMTDNPAAFLFLKLIDKAGQETRNEYFLVKEADIYDWQNTNWVNTPITHYASYKMLDELSTRSCDVTVKETDSDYEVTVSNPDDKVAFMIRLTAKDANGDLLCPAYWSDNYLTLAPGEKRTVVCKTHALHRNSAVIIEASN